MEESVYPDKAGEPEKTDYVKFKEFLRFFVKQAEKNVENGRAESPTIKHGYTAIEDHKFEDHYKLDYGFNEIAGLNFTIRFFLLGHYGTELTTYINIKQFNIIGKFENKKITHLRNFIRVNTGKVTYTGEARELCEKWNRIQRFYSIENLEINNDNCASPNLLLKNMLDEYLKGYNELFKIAEASCKEVYRFSSNEAENALE
jgi:hypothetical protein